MAWDLQKAAAECRLEAANFQRRAGKAWLPSTRRFYLETADSYLRLAEGYEMRLNLKHNMDRLRQLRAERTAA